MYRLAATSWVSLEALINEGIGWMARKRCGLMSAGFNRVQSEGAGAAHSEREVALAETVASL